jgi:hypothetical protein
MARTIIEIYDEMIAEKQLNTALTGLQPNIESGQNLLTELTTASKVAVWRLIFFTVAVAIWTHEKIFDLHKAEIEKRASELITGTLRWYSEQALAFQYGDILVWNDQLLKYEYPSGSTGQKIVARASTIEVAGANNQIRIKIAKLNNSGKLVPLSATEQNSFTTYINRVKFAGVNLSVTNINPDQLKLQIRIDYNPLILTSTGELISTPGVFPVRNAINNYIANLPFDGVFNVNAMIDKIQSADGVIDPVVISCQAQTGSAPYTTITQNYTADAGYLEIDPSFPLDNTSVIIYNPILI